MIPCSARALTHKILGQIVKQQSEPAAQAGEVQQEAGASAAHEPQLTVISGALDGELVRRQRIEDALKRRVIEMEALYRLTDRLNLADSLDAIYAASLDAMFTA